MNQSLLSSHDYRTLTCACCGNQITVPMACKFRFCEICAPRRAARVRRRITWLIENCEAIPDAGIKMITLSTHNCKDAADGVRDLLAYFRKLRYRQVWQRYVFGGCFVIEITGRPGSWHPHLHVLVQSYFIPWQKLRNAWFQISRGTNCHILSLPKHKAPGYLTKYITKADVPSHLLEPLSDVLRRFRMFQRFGSWHSLRVPRRLHDYPCGSCGSSDWLAQWAIDYGHYRPVHSLADG